MKLLLLLAAISADIPLDKPGPADDDLNVAIRQATGGGTVTIGPGLWTLKQHIPEFRNKTGEPNRRIDVTIRGTPGQTVIRGIGRHDVLQLNAVAGVHFADLIIESDTAGSNGISLTNGTADVTCDRITVRGLKESVKGSSYDGGKAFTIQQAGGRDRSSSITFRDCRVENCPVAFGVDVAPNLGTSPGVIVIDHCSVDRCVAGVVVSFATHRDPPQDFAVDVFNSTFCDTKRPLICARAYDVRFCGNVVNTVAWPDMVDVYERTWPSSANVIVLSNRVTVTGNTFVYRLPVALFDEGTGQNPGLVKEANVIRLDPPNPSR